MSRMDTRFGAELDLGASAAEATDLRTRISGVRQGVIDLAAAFSAGEISQAEWTAEAKPLLSSLRELEKAQRVLEGAAREAAAALALAHTEAQAAAGTALAEQAEREALAIAHQTEMLAHEARQLAELETAQDREIASLERSIGAEARATTEATRRAAAEGVVSSSTHAETAALIASTDAMLANIAAESRAEQEALQFANAMFAEAGAAAGVAGKLKVTDEVTGTFITSTDRATSAMGKMAGGGRNLQSQIIAGSYAFQDFTATSGDLGAKLNSISNNLPTLLSGLGGLGIALSVGATAGIAVYRNWDSIAGLWETRNPFPKAARDIDGMKRELDATKESLEKFEKAGTGNAGQIESYNKALERTVALKKQIADEEERQQLLQKALTSKTDEQEGRGKGFEEATKGKGQEVQDQITEAYRVDLEHQAQAAKIKAALAIQAYEQEGHTQAEVNHFATQRWQEYQETLRIVRGNDPRKLAEQLQLELLKGQENAGKELGRLMHETGVMFGDLEQRMVAMNPETKKRNAELNTQGQAGEAEALKELAGIKKEAADQLKEHLDEMKELGGIDQIGKEIYDQAKGKGASGQGLLDAVKSGLAPLIQGALTTRGFAAPKGVDIGQAEAVDDAARAAFKRIHGDDVRDVAKAGKAGAKADAKDFAGELAAAGKEIDAQLKETSARNKAEADRIQAAYGKGTAEQFRGRVAQSDQSAPPEAVAKALAADLAQFFTTRQGGGATRGGAEQAAREIARQAGFEVTHEDFRGAMRGNLDAQQQPRRRVARRPAGAATPQGPPAQALAGFGASAIPVLGQAVQTATKGAAANQATLQSQQAALGAMKRLEAEEMRLQGLAAQLARQFSGVGTRLNQGRR